ncbi:MarR family transcriptional regulator [Paenibacillus sp. FSL M8-0334]|uniref:MarR family winged helix-turn-helix transcriptional regulator n=1 Tax=Paenibacillus sp. FSL M8-0334 TaxID=2921623 RepID=UPI0030FCAAB0
MENDHQPSEDEASSSRGWDGKAGFENSVARNLVRSIYRFHRQEWEIHMNMEHTPGEVRVLMSLLDRSESPELPGLKVSEISNRMRVTSPTITQFVKGLEKKGLVERVIDEKDRRAVRVCLTAEGKRVVEEVQDNVTRYMNGLVDYLGEEDSRKLTELLNKASTYRSRTLRPTEGQDMERGR